MSNPATNWEDAYRVQTARIAELWRENADLRAHAERVGEANDRLVVENDALRATLDIIISADERAVELWRAAHPDKELVIPDRAKLVGWLLEQNDALRADKARLDWMQEMNLTVLHHAGNVFGRGVKVPSTRQAIDAAMKEGK